MSIREQILQELRNGKPLSHVMKQYRKSLVYEAAKQYLSELDRTLKQRVESVENAETRLNNVNAELRTKSQEKAKVSNEVARMSKQKEVLAAQVKDTAEKRDQMVAEMKGLEAKGYSPDIMKKLRIVDAKGPQILSQVATVKQRSQLEVETAGLEKRRSELESQIRGSETRRKSIERARAVLFLLLSNTAPVFIGLAGYYIGLVMSEIVFFKRSLKSLRVSRKGVKDTQS